MNESNVATPTIQKNTEEDAPSGAAFPGGAANAAGGSVGYLSGARMAIPIVLGYFPAGFAFGVLAREAGLSTVEVFLMSLVVYTGSSQFITVAQMAAGAPYPAIVATCAIVNLRYLLMSASIAPKCARLPFFHKLLFGVELTDESYFVNSARSEPRTAEELAVPPLLYETLGVNTASHAAWIGATTLGCFLGGMLGDVERFGIDFGLVAIFIALLAPRMKDRRQLQVILFAGAAALCFFLLGFGTWSVILATVAGATLGAFLP